MTPKTIRSMLFTRRYYAWERSWEAAKAYDTYLLDDTPMNELQALALQIWKDRRMPKTLYVSGGRGTPHGNRLFSYCQKLGTEVRIVLARPQRNLFVLLHEMAHALGPHDHNRQFARLHLDLLTRYGGASRKKLVRSMEQHEIL